MKLPLLVAAVLAAIAPTYGSGDYSIELVSACDANELSSGMHYVSFSSAKLETISPKRQSMKSKTLTQVKEEASNKKTENIKSEMIQLIDTNTATTVYLLLVNCINGDMYIDIADYNQLFDDFFTPAKGYEVTDIGLPSASTAISKQKEIANSEGQSKSQGIMESSPNLPGHEPIDGSGDATDDITPDNSPILKTDSKKVKWTAQYIVWLVLIIMVGVFALGIFLLLYWWCCHARTYTLVPTSSYPHTPYTQIPHYNGQVYGTLDGGAGAGGSNHGDVTNIDDTMVSQTVTVEDDVLP